MLDALLAQLFQQVRFRHQLGAKLPKLNFAVSNEGTISGEEIVGLLE